MKKKIGILSLLLVLAMVLVLLPGLVTEAEAATATSVKINGYTLSSGQYISTSTWNTSTTEPSGGFAYFSGGQLTLYDAKFTAANNVTAIEASGDLTISLLGTNTVNAKGTGRAISVAGNLTVTGYGSLTASSERSYCIYSEGNMELANNGKLTAKSTLSGAIACYGDVLTINSYSNVTASSDSTSGIFTKKDLTINSGIVSASSGHSSYYGIWCQNFLTVNGGTVTITSEGTGIRSNSNVYLYGGDVTVTADGNGIQVDSSASYVSLKKGELTVTAVENGIKANRFYVNGGTAYIKSTNTSSDSTYSALKLGANSSSNLVLRNCAQACGSTTTSSGGLGTLGSLAYSSLASYDYVYITSRIYVNGVDLREGRYLASGKTSAQTSKPSGGYAYFSGDTLTLNNYTVTNHNQTGISAPGDLKINLVGTNSITTSTSTSTSYRGITTEGDLTFTGTGTLTVKGGLYAIYSKGEMDISEGTFHVNPAKYGIYAKGGLNITGGNVNVNSDYNNAIWCDGSTLNISGGYTQVSCFGDAVVASKVNVTDGLIIAKSTDQTNYDSSYRAIKASITLSSGINSACSTSSSLGYDALDLTKLSTLDYIALGDFVIVRGVLLSEGQFLHNGSTTPSTSASNAGYAYYSGNGEVVLRNYTFSGNAHGVYANMPLTVLLDGTNSLTTNGYYGIFSTGDITIKGRTSDNDKLTANASNSVGICTQGALTINGDEIIATGYYAGLDAVNNINITSGIVKATAVRYGVNVVNGSLNITGGVLTAISTDTASDSSYSAINLKSDSTTYFKPANNMIQIASGNSDGSSAGTLTVSKLSTYDYVRVGDFVEIFGNVVPSGYSFKDRAVVPGNAGTGSAYFSGSTLTLNGFNGTGTSVRGINAFSDLYIEVKGASSISSGDYRAIHVDGNLTIRGTHNLSITTAGATSIYVTGDVSISDINVTANSDEASALDVGGNVTINSGKQTFNACKYGVKASKLIINGGEFVASSSYTTNDNSYAAVKLAGNSSTYFQVASGYSQAASYEGTRTNLVKLSYDNLANFDYVEIGKYIIVRGVNVPDGYSVDASGNLRQGDGGVGYAYYKDGVLRLTNFRFTGSTVRGIEAFGDLTIISGTTGSGNYNHLSTGDHAAIFVDGKLTLRGNYPLELVTNDAVALITRDMTLSNIRLSVKSSDADAASINNLTIESGSASFSGGLDGLSVRSLVVNGGQFNASTTSTSSSDYAVDLFANTADFYKVSSSLVQAASTANSTAEMTALKLSEMETYKYVQIGDFVVVAGVVVPNGYSVTPSGNLKQGNGGQGYAYYKDGVLTLTNFRFTGSSVMGIQAFDDLTIVSTFISGNANYISTGKYGTIYVDGDLTIKGDDDVEFVSTDEVAIFVSGSLTISDITVNVKSTKRDALLAGNTLKITSGFGKFYGGQYGIYVTKVAITGGQFIANSTATTSDGSYRAVRTTYVDAASFSVASGLYAAGSNASTPTNAEILKISGLEDYDYVYVGDYVLVSGVIVPSGYYLNQGSTTPTASSTAANRVYYNNGLLTMTDYVFEGTARGISSPHNLNLKLYGTNRLSTSKWFGTYVDGDLAISGTGKLSLLTTTVDALEVTGNISLTDASLTVRSEESDGIFSTGLLIVNSGSLTAISNGASYAGIRVRNMEVKGGEVSVIAKGHALQLNQNSLKVSGGEVTLTSSGANGINGTNATITLSGGTLNVTGKQQGIVASKLTQTGGELTAKSTTDDATDGNYQALKVTTISVDDSLVKIGSTYSNFSAYEEVYDSSKVDTYDYVYFAPQWVKVNGITVGDGCYMAENALAHINSKPASGRYVYRDGNKLYLYNFAYTAGGAIGIETNGSLEIINSGTSVFSCGNNSAIKTKLGLIIGGSGNLSLTSNTTVVSCKDRFETGNVNLTISSSGGYGITAGRGDVVINSGNINILSDSMCISCADFTMNGGTLLAKCSNTTTTDTGKYSLGVSGTFTLASGMTTIASTEPNGANPGKLDPAKLNTYDYVKIEQGEVGSGVTVSGKVTSYITTGTVTIKLYKSGSNTAAYTTTVSAASGTATSFSISGVAAGTYTMEISKANHATRTYTITVGSSAVTQDAKICPIGDVTGDGVVNIKDFQRLLRHVNKTNPLTDYALACGDVTKDGNCNIKDFQRLLRHVNKTNPLF